MPKRKRNQEKSHNWKDSALQRGDTVQQNLESTAAREDTARFCCLQALFVSINAVVTKMLKWLQHAVP